MHKQNSKIMDYFIAFFLLVSLNFCMVRALPGDPVAAVYGEEATLIMSPAQKAELIARMGLDKPVFVQWLGYLGKLMRFDLGWSYHFHKPVTKVLFGFAPWTFLLVGTGLFISLVLGFFLGIFAGCRHGKISDTIAWAAMMCANCLPAFVLGMLLLMFFGFHLHLFPVSGAQVPFGMNAGMAKALDIAWHMALPVCALVIHETPSIFFLARGTAVLVSGRPFVLVGHAKGLPETVINLRYIGRNSLAPSVANIGVMLAHGLTGVLFVEVVFSYPGLGQLAYEAILNHDYPVVQGVFLLIAVIVFLINIVVDIAVNTITCRG